MFDRFFLWWRKMIAKATLEGWADAAVTLEQLEAPVLAIPAPEVKPTRKRVSRK